MEYADNYPSSPEYESRPMRKRRFLLGPILLALLYIAFQYFSAESFVNPETGKTVKVALSPEQEGALGLQGFREVLSQSETIDTGPEYDMVNRVVGKIVAQVDEESREYDWAVSVIKSDQVNAFCLPGGKVAVYTGILPVAQNDAGLATVLGHEIAHATARHGAQRLFQQQLVQTAMLGVNGSLMEMDPQQRQSIMAAFGAGVQYGLVLPYGRDHEAEADAIGLKYMVRAGYDPNEAVRFWERMAEVGGAQPPEWASTHPSHDSRIQRLKRLIAEMGKQSPAD